jgi:hypothetical protein
MQFRKKPVVIDAIRARAAIEFASHEWASLPSWLSEAYERGDIQFAPKAVHIKTLEGVMRADLDDMIIRGVKGEIYPCKPDIFSATYESAGED